MGKLEEGLAGWIMFGATQAASALTTSQQTFKHINMSVQDEVTYLSPSFHNRMIWQQIKPAYLSTTCRKKEAKREDEKSTFYFLNFIHLLI